MPLLRAVPVVLSAGERITLNKRVRGAKTAHRDRLRAQIVLAAARGRDNARIGRDLGISQDTVRKWRGRFAVRGLPGLADLPRSGRPRRISELTRAAVVALACQLPAATGGAAVPLDRSGTAGRDRQGRAVSVTLAADFARGYPIVSFAAACLLAAVFYAMWVRAGRPRGVAHAERIAEAEDQPAGQASSA